MNAGGFSPDGRWFATWGNSTVGLWDGRTGAPVSITGAVGARRGGFSRDGKRIVTIDGHHGASIWDVRTGEPLSQPMGNPAADWLEGFSADGRFVQTYDDGKPTIWSVPPALREGSATPEWLLQLATICATKIVNGTEQCVDAPEVVAQIDAVRRQLAALPDDAPLVEWGRWLLDDSPTRAIAPGFTITPREADQLAATLTTARPSPP